MLDILDIIKNVNTVYTTNSSLSVLKDFERVLDEMDMYVYKNWEDGELVLGPDVQRHWITASFMWPKDKMPDPMGAKRLLDYGCKVVFKESHFIKPRKVKKPDDLRPGTKKGKLDRHPIWVVEITMPKKLVDDIFNGYMSKMRENMGIGRTEGAGAQGAPAEAAEQAAAAAPAAPAGGAQPAAPAGVPNAQPAA
jgi:hypothetical protein